MVRKNNKSSRKGFDSKYVIAFVFVLALFLSVVNVFNPTGMAVIDIANSESTMTSDLNSMTRDGDGTGDFNIYTVSDCKGDIEISYRYIYVGNSDENDAHIYIKLNDEVFDDNSFKTPRVETFNYNYRFDKSNYAEYSFSVEGSDNIGVGDELTLSYKNGDHIIMITDVMITCDGIEKGSLCWDSDDGKYYDVAGHAIDGSIGHMRTTEYYDACVGDYVYEKYCSDGMVETEKHKCDVACKGGKCYDGNECTDTDGGNEPFVKGTVTYGENSRVDECITDSYLNEQVCGTDGRIKQYGTPCLGGCEDGVCKPDPVNCVDTDGGDDNFLKGVTTVGNLEKVDNCVTEEMIEEFFCNSDGDDIEHDRDLCDLGCLDGACVCEDGDCVEGYDCEDGACVEKEIEEEEIPIISTIATRLEKGDKIELPDLTVWEVNDIKCIDGFAANYVIFKTDKNFEGDSNTKSFTLDKNCKFVDGDYIGVFSGFSGEHIFINGDLLSNSSYIEIGLAKEIPIISTLATRLEKGDRIRFPDLSVWELTTAGGCIIGEYVTINFRCKNVGGANIRIPMDEDCKLENVQLSENGLDDSIFISGYSSPSVSYVEIGLVEEDTGDIAFNWVGESIIKNIVVDGTDVGVTLKGVTASNTADLEINGVSYTNQSIGTYLVVSGKTLYLKSVAYYGTNNAAVVLEVVDNVIFNWVGESITKNIVVDGTDIELILDGVTSSSEATIKIGGLQYYHIISNDEHEYMIINGKLIYIESVLYYGTNNAAVILRFEPENSKTRNDIEYTLIEGVEIKSDEQIECSSGDKRCLNNDLQVCANSTFTTSESCENGCNPVDFECYDQSRGDLQKIIDQLQAAIKSIQDIINGLW
jgi:hypothetical protein